MKQVTLNQESVRALQNNVIAIIGYGSQGRAHAKNLHDSGFNVVVGLRPGSTSERTAKADGLKTASVADATKQAKLVAMMIPDMAQAACFENEVKPNLQPDAALLFAHGFNIHYQYITPPENLDVVLVAPKGPGDLVRREFERGRGVPALYAVHQNASGQAKELALAYAYGLGAMRAGLLETSFKEETETDLFGEQAVLCGGATELVLKGYETLIEAGYQPEVAYFECMHELKLIVDLLYDGGLKRMHQFVSETAKYGDLVSGPRVITEETKARMKDVLTDIQSGAFAKAWMEENQTGKKHYQALLDKDLSHDIERVGEKLRARMSWLSQNNDESEKEKAA